jgi:Uma2 family endonuclease
VLTWLGTYQALTPGIDVSVEPTLRLDMDNEPQPDAVLFIDSAKGGGSRIDDEGYLTGSPELIVEIAASSASIDLSPKKRAYRRNSIREYLVWQTFERRVDWFVLEEGEYRDLQTDSIGVLRSSIFPGLCLAVDALITDRMPEVLATLQRGMASSEYRDFIRRLHR